MILGLTFTQVAVIGVMLTLLIVVGWLYLAGDTEDGMVDEEPTLNTRGRDDTWTSP